MGTMTDSASPSAEFSTSVYSARFRAYSCRKTPFRLQNRHGTAFLAHGMPNRVPDRAQSEATSLAMSTIPNTDKNTPYVTEKRRPRTERAKRAGSYAPPAPPYSSGKLNTYRDKAGSSGKAPLSPRAPQRWPHRSPHLRRRGRSGRLSSPSHPARNHASWQPPSPGAGRSSARG